MKNATPKLPLFSFFMFLFEKTPIRPRTSFLSGQKMPPCPGSWPGLPYLQSRKKRRKPLQLIFLRFTNRLRIWPKVTDESKKIDKHHRAPVDFGWVGGIRTHGCGSQSPVPYRLATTQQKRRVYGGMIS